MRKMKVGVLMGGKSVEKEVSFNSGRTVCDHLDATRYQVIPLFQQQTGELFILPFRFLHRGKTTDFEHRLKTEAQQIAWDDLKQQVDFVYLTLHGRYAEDGTIQGLLEVFGIPYLGSKVFASALGMDKVTQKTFLRLSAIDIPRDITVTPHEITHFSEQHIVERMGKQGIDFPCIVKPHKEGSSLGISVVTEAQTLGPALHAACNTHNQFQQSVLIEEKIVGMEFTCIILTDYKTGQPIFLPPTEIVYDQGKQFYDYEQKYMPGRATKFTPARCGQESIKKIHAVCLQVMQALVFENVARTDGFLTPDGRVVIIDPNSLTGMGPASVFFKQAAEVGISHTQLINHLIETELHRYGMLTI